MSFPSDLLLAFSLANSASAIFVLACSCPFDRKASANSPRIWAVPSLAVLVAVESFVLGSANEVFAAFSASRTDARSRRFVTVDY